MVPASSWDYKVPTSKEATSYKTSNMGPPLCLTGREDVSRHAGNRESNKNEVIKCQLLDGKTVIAKQVGKDGF